MPKSITLHHAFTKAFIHCGRTARYRDIANRTGTFQTSQAMPPSCRTERRTTRQPDLERVCNAPLFRNVTLSHSSQNLDAWKAIQAGDLVHRVAHVRAKYLSSALCVEEYARCRARHLAEANGRDEELAPFTFFGLRDSLQRLIGHDGGKHETSFAARPATSVPVWSAWRCSQLAQVSLSCRRFSIFELILGSPSNQARHHLDNSPPKRKLFFSRGIASTEHLATHTRLIPRRAIC